MRASLPESVSTSQQSWSGASTPALVSVGPSPTRIMCVRRGSAYLSLTACSSTATAARIFCGERSSACRFLIVFCSALYSSFSFCCSRRASLRNGISRMALACFSLSLKRFISALRAAGVSADLRMTPITTSSSANAVSIPSRMCARSFACERSNCERLRTTSRRCCRNTRNACLSVSMRGSPFTSASRMMLKVLCSGVSRNRLRTTSSGWADLVRSMTMRMP